MLRKVTLEHNLQVCNPTLSKEWHPTKNYPLTPSDVTPSTQKKVWWQCGDGHEWLSSLNNRSRKRNGTGCPYCAKRIPATNNRPWLSLSEKAPQLSEEWHPIKNNDLKPSDVKAHSREKAWWRCSRGHEWQTAIKTRVCNRTKCPRCRWENIPAGRSLFDRGAEVLKEWHPSKNGLLDPKKIYWQTNKKAWWKCKRGHEWRTQVNLRTAQGTGCPHCNAQTSAIELRIFAELKLIFNEICHRKKLDSGEVDIWIPELNVAIEYDGVRFHKDKYQKDAFKTQALHEEGVTLIRIREKGLERISESDLVYDRKQWTELKLVQEILKLVSATAKIDIKAATQIREHLASNSFQNQREYIRHLHCLPGPVYEKSLAVINPSLSSEWHPYKNGTLKPTDVSEFSNFKVWWKCKNGHEWNAPVNRRQGGSGCPYCCNQLACSDNNLRVLHPRVASEWHPLKNKLLPTDFVPGSNKKAWWRCSKGHEWQAVIVARTELGTRCPYCTGRKPEPHEVLAQRFPNVAREWHPTKNIPHTPDNVSWGTDKKYWWLCRNGHEWTARVVNRTKNKSNCPFCSGRRAGLENSLARLRPDLSAEWHKDKNGSLRPDQFKPQAGKKVWWLCSQGHEWRAKIQNRHLGTGCPTCHKLKRSGSRRGA